MYRGIVTDNDDAASLGRIKAQVPAVLGDAESGWCMPCVPYAGRPRSGIAFLPEVGSGGLDRVRGRRRLLSGLGRLLLARRRAARRRRADVKVIVTAAPLELKLDDDGESITLTDPNGNTVTLDSDGITLANGGQQVVVSDSSVSVNDGALEVS